MKKPVLSVISGDIAQVKSDAIITAINSGGAWFGGIDRVINNVAGNQFHKQAAAKMPLKDGQVIVANNVSHRGEFSNVVFVVDELNLPLHEIIYKGLKAASDSGFKSVSLPTIRMGVMLGLVEKSPEDAVTEMFKGVQKFIKENDAESLENITFVIYRDENTKALLQKAMN